MRYIFTAVLPYVSPWPDGKVAIGCSTPKANKVLLVMDQEEAGMLFQALGQVLGVFTQSDPGIEVRPKDSK